MEFTGYADVVSEGSVRGIVTPEGVAASAREGDEVELVLDRTPFYAEGGGQLADQGVVELENGDYLMSAGSARPLEDAFPISQVDLVEWCAGEFGMDRLDAYQLLTQVSEAPMLPLGWPESPDQKTTGGSPRDRESRYVTLTLGFYRYISLPMCNHLI